MNLKEKLRGIKLHKISIILLFLILVLPFILNIFLLSKEDYKNFIKYLIAGNNSQAYIFSFLYSLAFMCITVLGQIFLGLLTAYLSYFSVNGKKYIVLFFIPYTFPLFMSTLSTRLGFETNGFITNILNNFFVNDLSFYPLSNNIFSFILLITLSIWQYFPFVFFVIYTMMRRTNNRHIEMAITDGGSNYKIFTKIMLPTFKGIIFPLILLRLLFMFNKYDIIVLFSKSINPPIKLLNLFPLQLRNLFNSINFEDFGFIIVLFILSFFIILSYLLNSLINAILQKI